MDLEKLKSAWRQVFPKVVAADKARREAEQAWQDAINKFGNGASVAWLWSQTGDRLGCMVGGGLPFDAGLAATPEPPTAPPTPAPTPAADPQAGPAAPAPVIGPTS